MKGQHTLRFSTICARRTSSRSLAYEKVSDISETSTDGKRITSDQERLKYVRQLGIIFPDFLKHIRPQQHPLDSAGVCALFQCDLDAIQIAVCASESKTCMNICRIYL